jgi:maltose O-acetyltransferase
VTSRAWTFYVNELAASPLLSRSQRHWIYARAGLDIATRRVYPRCYFHSNDLRVGAGSLLNHGVHIENVERVEIGERTALGVFTTVLTSTHEVGPPQARAGTWIREPVTIGDGCWLGARCVVLPGVTIGDGCVVAAGSLVREDCDANGVYAGVPARRIRDA